MVSQNELAELRKFFPKLRTMNTRPEECPMNAWENEKGFGIAHTHQGSLKGIICVRSPEWIWAPNQINYPAEVIWHEYAHVLQVKSFNIATYLELTLSNGHGNDWMNALNEIGHPWISAAPHLPHDLGRTPEAIQKYMLSLKRLYEKWEERAA